MATINGTALANLLNGTNAADTINGQAGDDTLNGGNGNDRLDGGAGNDSMAGGAGNDLYIVNAALDTVVEASGGGTDTVQSLVTFTLPVNVENLVLAGNGNINGTGNTAANSLTGNAGDNRLTGLGGHDSLNGGAGDDTMSGGTGNDLYYVDSELDRVIEAANGGVDTVRSTVSHTLSANAETLVLTGGDAADGGGNSLANSITGNGSDNTLVGMGGNDTLNGGGGDDDLSGNSGADLLRGGAGDDELSGGAGADTLEGGEGEDNLSGGAGNDLLKGGAGADALAGGSGFDTATYAGAAAGVIADLAAGGSGGDALGDSYNGIEKLVGSAHADALTGDDFGNVIDGGAGADEIRGGAGDDTIHGDAADTLLDGGGGANDRVVLAGGGQTYDFTSSNPLVDVEIVDLSAAGNDTLILESVVLDDVGAMRIEGAAGDAIATTDLWMFSGDFADDYRSYSVVDGGNVLLVNNALDVSGIRLALSLDNLDGVFGGARLDGENENDASGVSVSSAGDVNGDGYDDILVGAVGADPNGSASGAAYVIFGSSSGFGPHLNLSALDGANGFKLSGVQALDFAGASVSGAGDVNGDGVGDIIVGAYGAPNGDLSGSSYVVFGNVSGFGSAMDLSALDGTTGFRLDGIDAADRSGYSVASAGDVNGDGYADLIIGARGADPGGDSDAGESYVVFGKASGFGSALELSSLDGTNGFRLDGIDLNDRSGHSVASAGDVNADGYADLLIGAYHANVGGDNEVGESYVVFGMSGFGSALDLAALNGDNGFRLDGIDTFDWSGYSAASAGDVNGDGHADLIIGAVGSSAAAGESYVVFGAVSGFGSALDLSALDGTNGFRLDGIDGSDLSGFSVASAGDVNGDGLDDLLIGAKNANGSGGETYLVFGRASGFGSSLALESLDGEAGYRIVGSGASGHSISAAGDVNGDGFSDIIIGAPGADLAYSENAGSSYAMYGGDFSGAVTHAGTAAGDVLTGTTGADVMIGGQGADTLAGGGGADVIRGGAGNDRIAIAGVDFADIDGGRGEDTLVLAGTGLELNLTVLADSRLTGIEAIDVTSGDHTLKLSLTDLLNLSDTSNLLTIDGDAGDAVSVVDGSWVQSVDGGYNVYTLGAATLRIDTAITDVTFL
jgi:hypothetical protein